MRVEINEIYRLNLSQLQINAIIIDGGSGKLTPGFCWDNNDIPTINSTSITTTLIDNKNIFTANINNLESGTEYKIRAFLINNSSIVYSDPIKITTLDSADTHLHQPVVEEITTTSIHLKSKILYFSNSNDPALDHGFCWGENPNPTILNNSTSNGPLEIDFDYTIFYDTIVNLKPRTTYFIRAYCKNKTFVSYSNQKIAITEYDSPIIQLNFETDTLTYANVFGQILDSKGIIYTAQGVLFIPIGDNSNSYGYIYADKNASLEFDIGSFNLKYGASYRFTPFLLGKEGYYFSESYQLVTKWD